MGLLTPFLHLPVNILSLPSRTLLKCKVLTLMQIKYQVKIKLSIQRSCRDPAMMFQYLFLLVALTAAKDLVVDVDMENIETDVDEPSLLDRTALCCAFGRNRCVDACSGQLCTSSCTARCGFLRTCSPLSCQAIASSTCSSSTSSSSGGTVSGGIINV